MMSQSFAEAEYRSMANTTCEHKWVNGILSSLGIIHPMPMQLYCDSQVTQNHVFHECTKHIEVNCHFVRNEIIYGHL